MTWFLRTWDDREGLPEIVAMLQNGAHRHDVLQYGIQAVENDAHNSGVGYGGAPNLLGYMECDAAFMDGVTLACGTVGGLQGDYSAVAVARKLMARGIHTGLVGDGARLFAEQSGLPQTPMLADTRADIWRETVKPQLHAHGDNPLIDLVATRANLPEPDTNYDTSIMIASDRNGISGAASTAGWDYKHPGRVGDTPIIGAGLYVDATIGACACSHTGEMAVRTALAAHVVSWLGEGYSVADALDKAIDRVARLQGGVRRALVVHAVDKNGNADAVAINADHVVHYWLWNKETMADQPQQQTARAVQLFLAC